jgi:hypothetical protein
MQFADKSLGSFELAETFRKSLDYTDFPLSI